MSQLMDASVRSKEGKAMSSLCERHNSAKHAVNSWKILLS